MLDFIDFGFDTARRAKRGPVPWRVLQKRGWRKVDWLVDPPYPAELGTEKTTIRVHHPTHGTIRMAKDGRVKAPAVAGLQVSDVRHYYFGTAYGRKVWMFSPGR